MTDNERLAKWQEWEEYHSDMNKHVPDYLNDDAAAMSLLDTLVEKRLDSRLQSFSDDPLPERWQMTIWHSECYGVGCLVDIYKPTRREAVVAAVLELIEQSGEEDV